MCLNQCERIEESVSIDISVKISKIHLKIDISMSMDFFLFDVYIGSEVMCRSLMPRYIFNSRARKSQPS